MDISIYDKNTFALHVDKKELLQVFEALDAKEGPDYYFMAKQISETFREINSP